MSAILKLVNNRRQPISPLILYILILLITTNRANLIDPGVDHPWDYHNLVDISNASIYQLTNLSIGQRCTDSQYCQNNSDNVSCIRFSSTDKYDVCTVIDSSVDCQERKLNFVDCPIGSFLLKSYDTSTRCCLQTCRCQIDLCHPDQSTLCEQNYDIDGVDNDVNLLDDSTCCNTIGCQHEQHQQLMSRHKSCDEHKHGDTWIDKNCKNCSCKEGVAICSRLEHPICPTVCSTNTTIVEQQCCPRCKECFDEERQRHEHLAQWIVNNNGCKECECNNGKALCSEALCVAPTCGPNERSVRPDGHCCERCVCDLDCEFGFKSHSDSDGSKLGCECFIPITPATNCDPNKSDFDSNNINCKAALNQQDSADWSLIKRATIAGIVLICITFFIFGIICYVVFQRKKKKTPKDIRPKTKQLDENVPLNSVNTGSV